MNGIAASAGAKSPPSSTVTSWSWLAGRSSTSGGRPATGGLYVVQKAAHRPAATRSVAKRKANRRKPRLLYHHAAGELGDQVDRGVVLEGLARAAGELEGLV